MRYELRKNSVLSREEFEERLKRAEKYFFTMGISDPATEVGRINAIVFLAKLHFLQEKLGHQPRAMVIGAVDFSFQTSSVKFRYSVPEGAKIIWGDGSYEFIPAEMEFDFCGMLVGGLETAPKIEEILDKLYEIGGRSYEIAGVPVETVEAFGVGNHFLNLYRVNNSSKADLPNYIAVLHSSSNEFRKELINFVNERAERVSTPFGFSLLLTRGDAEHYYNRCRQATPFALRKRQLLFEEIFDGGKAIINRNHYEMVGKNQAVIGCNQVRKEGETLALLTTRDQPAYIFEVRKNLRPGDMERICGQREVEGWVYQELVNANLFPHGLGHCLVEANEVEKVVFYPKGKVILSRCRSQSDRADLDFDVAFRAYRSSHISDRIQGLGLGNCVATLEPLSSIKVDF